MIWRPATYPLMDGRNFVVRSGPGKGLAAGDAIGLLERHMMQMTSPPRLDPHLDHVPMPPEQVRRLVPGRPSVTILKRWCTRGRDGLILEHLREGHRILITPAAVQRFMARSRPRRINRGFVGV